MSRPRRPLAVGRGRRRIAFLALTLALCAGPASGLTAEPAGAAASPLDSTALWVSGPQTGAAIAAGAAQGGVRSVFVKAGEGPAPAPGYSAALVSGLRGAGLGVCAWTFDRGADPIGEAAVAIAAVRAGVACLVVDAEGEYDGRYYAAQRFVAALRRALGRRFPIGLAGQAETFQHPGFPYSVFLGPGAFDFTMPQMYWHELRLSVQGVFAVALGESAVYGRPVLPVGQLFDGVTPAEAEAFLVAAHTHGAAGASFFDLDAATPALLAALGPKPIPLLRARTTLPTVRAGADGDAVLWAQELLNAAGARLPVGGFYGAQTERALLRFQARRHLHRSGLLDPPTWRALLRLRAREPSWAKGPPLSAGQP